MIKAHTSMPLTKPQAIILAASVMLFLAVSLRILISYPLNWDEGWNLTPAMNLIKHGHYGVYLEGKPISPVLSGTSLLVGICTLSIRMFGEGIWQPRLIFFVISCLTMTTLYFISRRLKGTQVAVGTLAIASFCTPAPLAIAFHGAQIFGEVPMLLCFLLGLFALTFNSRWRIVAAAVLFSLAINFKLQFAPILYASIGTIAALICLKRRWVVFLEILVLGALTYVLVPRISQGVYYFLIDGLRSVTPGDGRALPIDYMNRIIGLLTSNYDLRFALRSISMLVDLVPVLVIATMYSSFKWIFGDQARATTLSTGDVFSLLNIVGVLWMCWYFLFSVGYSRYLFPAVVLLTPASAALLYNAVCNIIDWYQKRRVRTALSINTISSFCLISLLACQTIRTLPYFSLVVSSDWQPNQAIGVAQRLDSLSDKTLLVESVESEIFPFLNRSYYFPDEYQIMEHAERRELGANSRNVRQSTSEPALRGDIIVIGDFARSYGWYPESAWKDSYSTLFQEGGYHVLQRGSPKHGESH